MPLPGKTGAIDYGNYQPSPITKNNTMGIDVASNGGAQYVTCKSGAAADGKGRRVMFSWLAEGLLGATPHTARKNISTRALPRDITMTADNMLLQAPVPELQSLRLRGSGDTLRVSVKLTAEAGETALHLLPFRSNQFEISATFSVAATGSGGGGRPAAVGLRIMASDNTTSPSEFALIGLSMSAPPAGLAIIDRRRASAGRPASASALPARADSPLLTPPHDMGPDIGWVRSGGDVQCWHVSGTITTKDAASCATACEGLLACRAWTFVGSSSYNGPAPCSSGKPLLGRYCTLKSTISPTMTQKPQSTICGLPKRSAGWLKNHTAPPVPPPVPPPGAPGPPSPPPPPALAADAGADIRAGPMPQVGPHHQLHAFIDHSTVETFWDNRTAVTAHVWPVHETSDRVAIYLKCGSGATACEATVAVELWRLQGLF